MRELDLSEELSYRLQTVSIEVDGMRNANTAQELRRQWEKFLNAFGTSLGFMISVSVENPNIRAWGYKLKNLSNGGDEGLAFLREARNHVQHGIRPFADFKNPSTSYGNIIQISGNSEVYFSNNYISDGRGNFSPLDNFHMKVSNGRIESFEGGGRNRMIENPASVKLCDVRNPQKRKTFVVPTHINQKILKVGDPGDLAAKAFEFLREKEARLLEILKL